MDALLCLVLLAANPSSEVLEERVDLIELNHFFDDQGRHVFDQLIFYDWSPGTAHYQVRAWRLSKTERQLPQRDWTRGGYALRWQDGEHLRCVTAIGRRETWTQYDRELDERDFLPKELRMDLIPGPRKR